jgi:ERF superfamily
MTQADTCTGTPRRNAKSPRDAEVIAFMAMIERAVCNPDIDIEKLDRLLAWRDEEKARFAQEGYNRAMAAAQAEMEPVRTNCSNDQTRSRYASFAALDGAVRPIYSKLGFSLTFNTEPAPLPEQIRVVCTVRNGCHTERHQLDMPVDGKGAKGGDVMTKTHAVGSGVTYGRRYLLGMVFNIAVERDDDGNAAGRKPGWQQVGIAARQVVEKVAPQRQPQALRAAGRPPNMVPSPAKPAAAPAAPRGMEAAIADMTPPAPAIPAITPRRYSEIDPPPSDGLDIPGFLRR